MKILLLAPMVPQAEGAGAIPELLDAQLKGLLERHEVTVVGTYGDLAGQAEAAERLRREGVDVHFADRRRSASPLRRWRVRAELAAGWARGRRPWRAVTAAPEVQGLIDRLLAERDFDVIAVEDNTMSTFDLPPDLPAVLTEHEAFRAPAGSWRAERLGGQPRHTLEAIDWRRWEGFQREAWDRFDLIQVFSQADADAIAAKEPRLRDRLRVNPFGVDLPEPVDPALAEPETLLFVGTFTHAPNRDAALWLGREIMPRVRAARPGARLLIVGTVPPPEILDLAGSDGIEVIANAPSVRPHLEAATVVLAPVRDGGGMRMKVLQAMAAGKAVVTTRRGAEGFLALDPEPPLVLAESAEEIAAAIVALLGDPQRRQALAASARQFALDHHSPSAWAERLEETYRAAIERHAGPAARDSGAAAQIERFSGGAELRRTDWRFLLRRQTAPQTVVTLGGSPLRGRRRRRAGAAPGRADLVLLGFPTRRSAKRARAELAADGEVVCRWRVPRPLGTRRARSRLAAAGIAAVDFYWPGPRPLDTPEFWLPTERPGALAFLLAGRPAGSSYDRIVRWVWRAAARLGVLAPIYGVGRLSAPSPRPDRPGPIAELLPEPEPWLLLTGGSDDANKVVGLPFGGGDRPPATIVKFSRVSDAAEGIEWEDRVLRRIETERPSLDGVPRSLGIELRSGETACAQSAIYGPTMASQLSAANFAELASGVTGSLAELVGAMGEARPSESVNRLAEKRLGEFEGRFGDTVGAETIARLRERLAGFGPLPWAIEHRDLKPWNVLLTPEGPAIIDWEESEPEGLPALDAILLLTTSCFLVDGSLALAQGHIGTLRVSYRASRDPASATGATVDACLSAYREATGIGAEDLDRLRLLCWVKMAVISYGEDGGSVDPGNPFRPELFIALADEELDRAGVSS